MMTRNTLLSVAFLLSFAGVAVASDPVATSPVAAAEEGASTLERFLKIRTPGAPSIAPDGTMYVRDWPEGIFQLYKVEGEAAGPGAKMTKLTSFADGLSGYSLSPDGTKILLFHAVGGNENTQISVMDTKTKDVTPAASDAKVQFAANFWLRDSSGFVFTGNAESPNDFYVYRYDLATGKTTKLMGKPGSWGASDINPDQTKLLVGEYRSASDTSIFELNVMTGEMTDMTPKAGTATSASDWVAYMPDNQTALLVSDFQSGKAQLFSRDLADGTMTKPIPSLDAFEIEGASMNEDKTLLAVVTNEDGYGKLHVYRLPSFDEVRLPAIEPGVVSLASLDGDRIIWSLNNARTPGLAFTTKISAASDGQLVAKQITTADTQGLDLSGFPLPELVKYKAFDGLEVPAFLWLPKGYTKGSAIPFVVNYHGGPEGQSRPTFSATIQYLLNEGFGVMQPNVRGSTGYGREFHMMDDYKKRWDSVRDGVDAAEWLVSNGYTDAGRVATYGGSYGGFMSVACLVEDQMRVDEGKRSQRIFGSGVNVVGIVNLQTFLEKTSGYRRKLREVEYGPLTDPEFLKSVSSIHKADRINVPMFIAHGFNDPRVPVEEAMQLATKLKDQAFARKDMSLMPQLFVAPDEGHGFAKLDNRIYFNQRLADFLKGTIGKQPVDLNK
jgi:dipeptidyl aminopeptidase/acylaminoacyl peptidase